MQVFNIFCVGIASFFLFFGFWSRDLFTNLRIYDLQIYNALNEMDKSVKKQKKISSTLNYQIIVQDGKVVRMYHLILKSS